MSIPSYPWAGVTAALCRFISPLELHSARHNHCNGLSQAQVQQQFTKSDPCLASHKHQAACHQYDLNYPDHKRR